MMGAKLVAQVFTHWTHLPDRPFRVLVRMAHIAKDTNAKPIYWAGRDDLAQALGLVPGEAAYQAVKRAVRQIVAAGAVEIEYLGHATKRTEYRLTLDKMPRKKGVIQSTPRGSVGDPLRGSVNDPHRGSVSDPAGGQSVTPQGTTEGGTEENREESNLSRNQGVEGATSGEAKADSSQPRRSSDTSRRAAIARARAERRAS